MMKGTVGVLGGVGPLATVYFMNMIIKMTDADTDQEHIDMMILNHATMPDRTGFIMGRNSESPLNDMICDARMLEQAGCSFIVMPCNTAHYFLEEIKDAVEIPVLNIISETIKFAMKKKNAPGCRSIRLGIMATEGTVSSGTYDFYGKPLGAECIAPDKEYQEKIDHIIYDKIKAGYSAELEEIISIADHLRSKGCDIVIMGCTELSIVYRDLRLWDLRDDMVDSLEVLARITIEKAGKKLR